MIKQKLRIAVGADHAGFPVKEPLIRFLQKAGYETIDFGTDSDESTDYPDFALKVAKAVADGKADRGLLACGSGIGMAIMANKVRGIRAAAAWSVVSAELSAEHNWANVLCLSARLTPLPTLKKMVKIWLDTPFSRGGRHERRVKKIAQFESNP